MIRLLSGNDVISKWSKIKPLLDNALEYGHVLYDSSHLLKQIVANQVQCWIIDDVKAVVLTQVNVYPLGKELDLRLVAGKNMKDWFHQMEQELVNFARFNKCKQIKGYGRKAWERVAKQAEGWEFSSVSLVKSVM